MSIEITNTFIIVIDTQRRKDFLRFGFTMVLIYHKKFKNVLSITKERVYFHVSTAVMISKIMAKDNNAKNIAT